MRMMRQTLNATLAATALLILSTGNARAFDGIWSLCLAGLQRVTPDNLWRSWSFAPETALALVLLAGVYLAGARRSGSVGSSRVLFFAGWFVVAVALVSPLCRLAATLVSAHMAQFMLLVIVAPLLIALSRPGAAFRATLPASPTSHLPAIGLSTVTIAYGAAIWLWHVPAVYALLLTDPLAHVLSLAGLVAVSAIFWHAVLVSCRNREMQAVWALLATMIHTGLLGALLTFGSRPLYPILAPGALDWGLAPLEDQQIAGLIMWVPGGVAYMAAAIVLSFIWLRRLERTKSALINTAGS
jgi:putative membrane protein